MPNIRKNNMNNKLFEKYSNLMFEIKKMDEEKNLLRANILEELKKNKMTKTETDFGIFTAASRRSYKYTEVVKKLEEKVKLQKVKEEQKGTAKEKITEYLVYTPE